MSSFHFSDAINETYYEALEKLFFFNPGQSRYYQRIVETVETYGQPKIVKTNGMLTLQIEGRPSESLFISESNRLAGMLLYIQETDSLLNVLHFAVAPSFAFGQVSGSVLVVELMMEEIKKRARENPRIAHIKLSYTQQLIKI